MGDGCHGYLSIWFDGRRIRACRPVTYFVNMEVARFFSSSKCTKIILFQDLIYKLKIPMILLNAKLIIISI